MDIIELLAEIGVDKVRIQNLDQCADKLDWSAKSGTRVTFGTEVPLTPNGMRDFGMLLWLPREAVAAAIAKARGEAA